MATQRHRTSRICNRHAPYRETAAFAAMATRAWSTLLRRAIVRPLLPARPVRESVTPRSNAMYVCSCKSITESQVRCLRAAGATPAHVARVLQLDDPDCCGRCLRDIDGIVMLVEVEEPVARPRPVAVLSR